MLRALGRAHDLTGLVAVDIRWDRDVATEFESKGIEVLTDNVLDGTGGRLADRGDKVDLIVNLAGPFYALGTSGLELAMKLGADYMDICDDVDATEDALALSEQVEKAGIRALLGMGSAPGTTNILIRAALDALGDPASSVVRLAWVVDHKDMTRAALDHAFHCLATAVPDSNGVPDWGALDPKWIEFPDSVGRQQVILHGHPEPLTLPHFMGVRDVSNHGGLAPSEMLHTYWSLAREAEADEGRGVSDEIHDLFTQTQQLLSRNHPRYGSGMQIDVTIDGTGYRFSSGSDMAMEDATGVPAAAGVLLMREGVLESPGVYAPECLRPVEFFAKIRLVSEGGGGLHLLTLRDGEPVDRARIRDLIAAGSGV
jgi:saccharopine dehydrogenase (NAD+, L-lysine-forming)